MNASDDEIARYIRALESADDLMRSRATRALITLGASAVPALIETLNGTRFLARIRAAKILGEIGDVRAVQPLIHVLRLAGFQDTDTGGAVVGALARFAQRNPLPELREVLPLLESNLTHFGGDTERIRAALAPLPQPEVAPLSPDEQARQLVERLRQTFPFGRGETARALVALGTPAVSPLIELLRWSPVPAAREAAAEALCAIGDARAVEPLLAALKDEMEPGTRGKMARRLQSMALQKDAGADRNFARPLLDALSAEAADVQNLAFKMLVAAGPPAVPALVAALTATWHTNGKRRRDAALILGHIAAPEAAEELRAACADEYPTVRSASVAALGSLNDVRPSDSALLIEALNDNSNWVRRHAAAALGALATQGTPTPELRAALPPLRRRVRSPLTSGEVRDACQKAVQQIEAATDAFKDLPLPSAAAPSSSAENLPLPANAPPPSATNDLPLPAAGHAGGDEPSPGWWARLKAVARGRLG